MRHLALLVLLAAPARAGFDLESSFAELSTVAVEAKKKAKKRRFQRFETAPASAAEAASRIALDVPLSEMRGATLSVLTADIGGKKWSVGAVVDSACETFFLVLTAGAERLLVPLKDLGNWLDNDGVLVEDSAGPALQLYLHFSLLHPINGTSISAGLPSATRSQRASFKMGELIEALGKKAKVFKAGENEIWAFGAPEADNSGQSLTAVNSIILARSAGLGSKGWAIRESELAPDVPRRVTAFGRVLVLTKTSADRLTVRDAGPGLENSRPAASGRTRPSVGMGP